MNFKRGMTLAETLLVFIVIGVIASLTISSVRPWEKPYKQTYMRMYNALNTTLFNYMTKNNKFPETTTDLCTMIVSYLNTSDYININSKTEDETPRGYCEWKIGLQKSLDVGMDIDENSEFENMFRKENAIYFPNGTRMWLGGKNHTYKEISVNDVTTKFYLVYLDINGDAKPNTPFYTAKVPADIVAFILTDKNTVVPIGWPELDVRYLQAHYLIPTNVDDEDDFDESEPLTYFEAKNKAYGTNSTNPNDRIISGSDPLTFEQKVWFGENMQSPFLLKPTNLPADIPKRDDNCNNEGMTEPKCQVQIYEYQ